ncbi:hypothetical protein EV363DRAFT_1295882 [Boletus edulis]|nr:hypothetical protein EV363DRAFT_1295882 [Boletus edulis]
MFATFNEERGAKKEEFNQLPRAFKQLQFQTMERMDELLEQKLGAEPGILDANPFGVLVHLQQEVFNYRVNFQTVYLDGTDSMFFLSVKSNWEPAPEADRPEEVVKRLKDFLDVDEEPVWCLDARKSFWRKSLMCLGGRFDCRDSSRTIPLEFLQFLYDCFQLVRGHWFPIATDSEEKHGVGPVEVHRLEIHIVVEYFTSEVNEDTQRIGVEYARFGTQLLFKKLVHSLDLQWVAVVHAWREWNSAVVAWDQNARELLEGRSGQDAYNLKPELFERSRKLLEFFIFEGLEGGLDMVASTW